MPSWGALPDRNGCSLIDARGELVVTEPVPSMPVFFWGDDDGSRYHESYFDMFPGVWRHGDWIGFTERGGAIITRRSDSTINRGGVRIGTGEIYRAVLDLDEVIDAIVVEVDDAIRLFVVLAEGVMLDDALSARVAAHVRHSCSPRHVPDDVRQIGEVPRTLSGKVLEVPVTRILGGTPVAAAVSADALANPASLDYFERLAREEIMTCAQGCESQRPGRAAACRTTPATTTQALGPKSA